MELKLFTTHENDFVLSFLCRLVIVLNENLLGQSAFVKALKINIRKALEIMFSFSCIYGKAY